MHEPHRYPGKHFSPRHLYLRSFILSFCISLLALMSLGAMVLARGDLLELRRDVSGENTDAAQVLGNAQEVPISSPSLTAAREEDALTVLIMGRKDEQSVSNTYLLVRFDPAQGRIPVLCLPPQTMVVKPQGDSTPISLSQAYSFGGQALAVQGLENTLGIEIDRYAVVEVQPFVEIASMFGPIQYLLGHNLSFQDEERSIQLSKGMQLVDGQKAVDIVTYPLYPGGDRTRAEITGALAVQIINTHLSLISSPTADSLFKGVINRISTDITYLDFEQRRRMAAEMATLSPAVQLFAEGGFDTQGGYLLSEKSLEQIRQYF